MNYNIWNKWDKLRTVMLGECYGPEFFRDIKNNRIRGALTQIAEETQEDLDNFESVLKDFGCTVLRPVLDTNNSIMNYLNNDGAVMNKLIRAPLQPRDTQLVMGNDLVYVNQEDHPAIKQCLDLYDSNYLEAKLFGQRLDHHPSRVKELGLIDDVCTDDRWAPCVTVVGKDVYVEGVLDKASNLRELKDKEFRFNNVNIGGHNDACFHTIKPGVILSLFEIQHYTNTFPNWDVCYLPDQCWDLVDDFVKFKKKVNGKWWFPGQEENDQFINFVETWLQDWVGYVEETVFDVSVLVLDEYHVCVSQMDNPTVNKFFKKHNVEPIYIPFRHRYFWDGGLHCITLDLYREGRQWDYFPARTEPVIDEGF